MRQQGPGGEQGRELGALAGAGMRGGNSVRHQGPGSGEGTRCAGRGRDEGRELGAPAGARRGAGRCMGGHLVDILPAGR